MKLLSPFLILFTSACLAGCGALTSDEKPSNNDHAQYLIDQEYYSEAIFTLNKQLEREPANPRTRVLLASSYAAKHGVVLTAFSSIAARLIANSNPAGVGPEAPSDNGLSPEAMRLRQSARQFKMITQAFRDLPVLETEEDAADIERAIALLDGPRLSRGTRILRALLQIVHVKYVFSSSPVLSPENDCRFEKVRYLQWLESLDRELQSAVTDLQTATVDPRIQADLEKSKRQIHATINDMRLEADSYVQEPETEETPPEDTPVVPDILEEAYARCAR